jgi:hypothetical protein
MKRKTIIFTAVLVGLLASWLLFSHSYIEIRLGQDATSMVVLTDQQNGRSAEITAEGAVVRRLVRRGSHEVLVRQADSSYFAIIETRGFLSTTTVKPKFSKEKARKFIGNNPSPCMYVIDGVLLSSACGDRISQLQVHVPATALQPTFSRKSSSPFNGFVEGIVQTAEGSVVVIKAPLVDEDEGPPHGAYLIDVKGGLSNGVALEALDENTTYKIAKYQDGFIAYSSESADAYYYRNMRAQPETIRLAKPNDTSLRLQNIASRGNVLVSTYSNLAMSTGNSHDTGEVHSDVVTEIEDKPKSEIVVQDEAASQHHSFNLAPNHIRLCAANKLCLLDNGVLEVIDIANGKRARSFKVGRVTAIESTESKLLIVRANEILAIDIDSQTGAIDYSFEGYGYCGIYISGDPYVVCATNQKRKRVALLINRKADDTDGIDKKINELLEMPDIKDVSIYGNFIHISPNVGEVRPNPKTGFFEYDNSLVGQANSRISQRIDELGISRSSYTIVNTVE